MVILHDENRQFVTLDDLAVKQMGYIARSFGVEWPNSLDGLIDRTGYQKGKWKLGQTGL